MKTRPRCWGYKTGGHGWHESHHGLLKINNIII